MGGHGHDAPPPKLTLPPSGVDPFPPQAEWTDHYGGKPVEDFPDHVKADGLRMKNWYNYLPDQQYPGVFPNADDNLRMWQELDLDRKLDYHPAHEIHSKDLPEYHFWPMIQNDVEPKFTGQVSELLQYTYHEDQCMKPRFHKNGMPKTPPQEQLWYQPLDENGRCDWRAITRRFLKPESIVSKVGWNQRYTRRVYTDAFFQYRQSMGIRNISKPIHFRHREINQMTQFVRSKRGYQTAMPLFFFTVYFTFLGTVSSSVSKSNYWYLQWECEPWNYDMHYVRYYRNKGTTHSAAG